MHQGLRVESLSCEKADKVLFAGMAFSVLPGEILQIAGENGSGKTSLLRILTGLSAPTSGKVYWQDCLLREGWVQYLSQLIYIGHKSGLKENLTVLENLRFACTASQSDNHLRVALQQVGLAQEVHRLTYHLSVGQQRRLCLARLVAQPAKIWILDEPLSALDSSGIELVLMLMRQQIQRSGLIILSSHHAVNLPSGSVKVIRL